MFPQIVSPLRAESSQRETQYNGKNNRVRERQIKIIDLLEIVEKADVKFN